MHFPHRKKINRFTCFLASLALVVNLAGPYLFALHLGSHPGAMGEKTATCATMHKDNAHEADRFSAAGPTRPAGNHDDHTCTTCLTYSHLQLCLTEGIVYCRLHMLDGLLAAPCPSLSTQEKPWSPASPRAPPQIV